MYDFSAVPRRNHDSRSERGVAMLGLLLSVIVLGVMVLIVLKTLGSSPSTSGTPTTIAGENPGTTTTSPVSPESGAQEAAITACQANYQAIETALADYRSLNGSSPAAGTSWATAATNGGPLLQSWPQSATYYTISWNGAQLSVLPVRGTASRGTDGTPSPKTGCFAA